MVSDKVSAMWMTIAHAARHAGVGVETIRFYERRGLIAQPRKPASGFREYNAETVARIRFIRQAQELGFSLREIEELLNLRADPNADCSEVRVQATTKRDEVEKKIADLKRIRAALDVLITACPGKGAVTTCSILDALAEMAAQRGSKPNRSRSTHPHKRTTGGLASRGTRPTRRTRMKTLVAMIDGMHCEGCAETIRALLKMESAVRNSTVSFEERRARILYDPSAASEEHLIAAIERGGYKVVRQTT